MTTAPPTTTTPTTTTPTTTPTTTEAPITCPQDYELNPFSMTCFRVLTTPANWDNAKAACEGAGEFLAVFDTVDSIEWFKFLRHTNSGKSFLLSWRSCGKFDCQWINWSRVHVYACQAFSYWLAFCLVTCAHDISLFHFVSVWQDAGNVWIGARLVSGAWTWFGRIEDVVTVGDWETQKPSGGSECVQVYDNNRGFALNSLRENYKWDNEGCSSTNSYICERIPK